jgi:hypothetical protein
VGEELEGAHEEVGGVCAVAEYDCRFLNEVGKSEEGMEVGFFCVRN